MTSIVRRIAACVGLAFLVSTACATQSEWRDEPIPAQRGTIRDRSGHVLATDGAGREFPYGELGAHAIGYVATSADGQVFGRWGVEAAWDDTLRGRPGIRRTPVDSDGHDVGPATTLVAPTPGHDLQLTLDMDLMDVARRVIGDDVSAAAVVVDVRDGSVLALYSAPGLDPTEMSSALTSERIDELRSADALVDRTIGRAYLPAGTVKPLTVIAGLETSLDPAEQFECVGSYRVSQHRMLRDSFHGELDARHAIMYSCSLYGYHIADQVGLDVLSATFGDFGLGTRTGLGLHHEVGGRVATVDTCPTDREPADVALMTATGEREIGATPLQVAMAYAAIANGGTIWTPRLVETDAPHADHHVSASAEHLALVRDALDATVNEPWGTGSGAHSDRVRIAGKQGHGRPGGRFDRAAYVWFAGYAPADDPEIAIVVLVEADPGEGDRPEGRGPDGYLSETELAADVFAGRIVEQYFDAR